MANSDNPDKYIIGEYPHKFARKMRVLLRDKNGDLYEEPKPPPFIKPPSRAWNVAGNILMAVLAIFMFLFMAVFVGGAVYSAGLNRGAASCQKIESQNNKPKSLNESGH